MMRLSEPMKKSSRTLRDQTGNPPPPVEIRLSTPGPGKGRTYTSSLPYSFDVYANQRPSADNSGEYWTNGVCRKTSGFPSCGWPESPSIGTVQIRLRPSFCWLYTNLL